MTDLGTLPGRLETRVFGVNEKGQAVGVGMGPGLEAFLWENGEMSSLGTLGGSRSVARSINNHGQVVGWSTTASEDIRAFLWEDGEMIDLGTLGGPLSDAFDINDKGQIVGRADNAAGLGRPFIWHDGAMTELNTLGGGAAAQGINSKGLIVGWSVPAGTNDFSARRAVLWASGEVFDLGTLGGRGSFAWSLNGKRQISGWSEVGPNNLQQPVVWSF